MSIAKKDTELYYDAFRRCHSNQALASRPEASILIGDYFLSLFAKSLLFEDRLDEIQDFAEKLETEIETLIDPVLMKKDIDRILSAGGKGLRTKLALICYDIGRSSSIKLHAEINSDPEPLLEVLDMLHNVSLIHDDAVDNAELRRGVPTINSTTGIFAAVQSGDWLLAETARRFDSYRKPSYRKDIDGIFTLLPLAMCEGELMQQRMRFNLSAQTEQIYFNLIYRKTAALFAASCRAGAIAGGAGAKTADLLECFGRLFGTAFQIRDDVLDFCTANLTGKKYAQDIRNGIYTLPVLMAAESMPYEIKSLLENKTKSEQDIDKIVGWLVSTGSLDKARLESDKIFSEASDVLKGIGHRSGLKRFNEVYESIAS